MTSKIKWGVFAPTFDPFGAGVFPVLEAAREAERLGFDVVWVGDHLICPAPVLDSICSLAAVTGVTSNIQLGLGVLQLGLRNLVWTAKQLTTLNVLAPGRIRLGVGVGGEFPEEFTASGVSLKTRGKRLDETLPLLEPLLTGQPVKFSGEHVQIESAGLQPAMTQALPLAVGGRSDAALDRVAKFGDEWLGMWFDIPALQQRIDYLSKKSAEFDRDDKPHVGMIVLVNVNDDIDIARSEVTDYLRGQYNLPFKVVERWTALGSIEMVADMLKTYMDVGVTEFVLSPTGRDFKNQYEQLARVRQLLDT